MEERLRWLDVSVVSDGLSFDRNDDVFPAVGLFFGSGDYEQDVFLALGEVCNNDGLEFSGWVEVGEGVFGEYVVNENNGVDGGFGGGIGGTSETACRRLKRRRPTKEKFEERALGARRAMVDRDVAAGDEISLAMVREAETAIASGDKKRDRVCWAD
ncbi:hypothetical protein NE237_023014 [Protea cynaroides]|uniref:Uncharacterized protein n=1 Tax=Protea cynaroides TaxID=273540 RepID=A0A9Q0HC34_9MAGN|nr:hypothetical protein NE237_023014 [Protea cynaroides]